MMRKCEIGRFLLVASAILLAAMFASCSDSKRDERRKRMTKEELIAFNRHLMVCDSTYITNYSDSLGLCAVPFKGFLWLTVHEPGRGDTLVNGDVVTLVYVVQTLKGDTIYTSAKDGVKTMAVGQCEVNIGIDEALRQLKRGAKATVIIPPEFAFGYVGDGHKIRRRMILRYDIQVE